MQLSAELTFGRPQRIYHADGYTVLVWDTNLLDKLATVTRASDPPVPGGHMYRMRRLATTSSAGSTQAAIRPR